MGFVRYANIGIANGIIAKRKAPPGFEPGGAFLFYAISRASGAVPCAGRLRLRP